VSHWSLEHTPGRSWTKGIQRTTSQPRLMLVGEQGDAGVQGAAGLVERIVRACEAASAVVVVRDDY